jgi:molybdopterin-binding protein
MFISHSLKEMRLMSDTVLVVIKGSAEALLPIEELARRNVARHIVPEAADEFGITKGKTVVAAIKASAFSRVA